MALTTRLDAYLGLERQTMALDQAGDPLADAMRDAMDRIWYKLSDEEHRLLDSRIITGLASLYAMHLGASAHLFVTPPTLPPLTTNVNVGKTYLQWGHAA